jgi:hypothetical protein
VLWPPYSLSVSSSFAATSSKLWLFGCLFVAFAALVVVVLPLLLLRVIQVMLLSLSRN